MSETFELSIPQNFSTHNFEQKWYVRITLFILLNCIYFFAGAQQFSTEQAEHFAVKDGLPDATATSVCQDEDGFLWIGTGNGLSRYDGSEFKNYYHFSDSISLPGNFINAIVPLSAHRLLISTSTGLCIFFTQKNIFHNLLIHSSAKMFPFENNFLAIAVDRKNNIWAGTQTCLYRLDTNLHIIQSWRKWTEHDLGKEAFLFVQSVKPLPNDNLLLQLPDGWKFYNAAKKEIEPAANLSAGCAYNLSLQNLRDIYFDKKGNAYFIKHLTDSIFYFDAASRKISAYPLGNNIGREQIYYSSHLSIAGNILLACSLSDGGLLCWQNSAGNNYNFKNNFILLPGESSICAFYDNEKNLWIGTENGLYKFTNTASNLDRVDMQRPNGSKPVNVSLSDIFLQKNKIFLTAGGTGFFYKDRDKPWKNILWNDNDLVKNSWSVRYLSGDSFWVATQQGMYWWRESNNTHGKIKWPGNFEWLNNFPITTQFEDSKKFIWMGIGQGNGVAVFDPSVNRIKVYSNKSGTNIYPLRYPTAINEDENGNMWMGGLQGTGLVEWNRKKDEFTLVSPLYNTAFDNAVIYAVYADHKGSVWLGTASGLIKYKISDKQFKKFDIAFGLGSNTVYSLCADTSGNLWIGTNNGLRCLNIKAEKILNFNGYYNLSEKAVFSVRYDTAYNKLYFITQSSFFSITPQMLLQQRIPPKLFITDINSSGNNLSLDQLIKLNYNNNNITISFSAVNLINGAGNNYFYYLGGSDKQWINLDHQRQISFSNLSPGNYSFHVKAQTEDGTWSVNEGIVHFAIATPFWKTWWFICLIVIVAFIIVYEIYQYRIKQFLLLQQVRSRIATDLHDDIGSALTNINILAELSRTHSSVPQKMNDFLNRISEEINTSNQSLDDIVWSVNTVNDSFEQIVARMRRYAAEIFEAKNIRYRIEFDESLAQKKLQMEQRRDLYLIFKEAVNNIYKHAEATTVDIFLKTEKNNFSLSVKDNGKGFDTSISSDRNGLKNIINRAKKWKGDCVIHSAAGSGTDIAVTMPVMH